MNGTGQSAEAATAGPVQVPRRRRPWILVVVRESADDHAALVWALREAARREATVVAVRVLDDVADGPLLDGLTLPADLGDRAAVDTTALDDAVLRAVVETGIQGRTRTAVLDPHVFAALTGSAHGADLVLVDGPSKTLLRRPTAPTGLRVSPHRL